MKNYYHQFKSDQNQKASTHVITQMQRKNCSGKCVRSKHIIISMENKL